MKEEMGNIEHQTPNIEHRSGIMKTTLKDEDRRLKTDTKARRAGMVAPAQIGQSGLTSAATDKLEMVESAMLKMPQADCPVTNLFAPGIYWREVSIPAGAIAIGHKHKTEHLNVLISGRVRVICDGEVKELVAPYVFPSPAGVRKILYAVEPARWANIHANPTDERDLEKLEIIFIEKSAAYLAHDQSRARPPRHSVAMAGEQANPTVEPAQTNPERNGARLPVHGAATADDQASPKRSLTGGSATCLAALLQERTE